MRYIRIMHFLFLGALIIADTVITSVFSQLSGSSFHYVSNLAFLGIILLIQNDNSRETLFKAAILSIWMDLNHVNSFPIFFVSYILTVTIMRLWERQITSSFMEFAVIALVALFIKDSLQYILVTQLLHVNLSYALYVAYRTVPSLIGNLLMVYPILVFYKKIHHVILNQTQNLRSY